MKNNTENLKALLQKAYKEAPEDFALTEVRFYIRSALAKIETVEKARAKRQVGVEKRQEATLERKKQHFNPMALIETIDALIAEEKEKLKEIKKNKEVEDGEVGDLFG